MHTIVMIGKANAQTQALHTYLRQYFTVQLCTEDAPTALGMVRVVAPELIVVSLAGMTTADRSVFVGLQREFSSIPVITIGTQKESLPFGSFHWDKQFENLLSPVANEAVLDAVCKRLHVAEQSIKAEAAVAASAAQRRSVLVVDDNAATLRSIKGMLEKHYNVTLANSGMKAMTSMGKSRPDVILLDYEMPVCDGRQTLEMIRADEELNSIPVIFLTSVNDKAHIEAVIKLLPAGYLLKPAIPERLIEAIEKALA